MYLLEVNFFFFFDSATFISLKNLKENPVASTSGELTLGTIYHIIVNGSQ